MTAAEFKESRSLLGLTQSQVASALGVSPRCIKYYEAGGRRVSQPVAILLASMTKAAADST